MITKDIRVYNKRGKELAPTSLKIAKTLVAREKAEWININQSLTLLYTKSEFKKLKNKIIEEEGRKCYICGEIIDIDSPATVDHVHPKSKYGKDIRENLRCCCKRCNDDKGDTSFYNYYNNIINNIDKYDYVDLNNLEKEKNRYIKVG